MNQLTKNIRTHILVLKDGRSIQLTQDQYTNLKLKQDDPSSKYTDSLVIKDADTGEILFDGKLGAINEFQHKIMGKDDGQGDWYWICDYGLRHKIIGGKHGELNKCTCYEKIGIFPEEFFKRLRKMGFVIITKNSVTDHMIREYKNKYKKNGGY